jgi:hypothetical protein
VIETERMLATNRAGWNRVAPSFYGGTALPEYWPMAPTEDTLHLLEVTPELRVIRQKWNPSLTPISLVTLNGS